MASIAERLRSHEKTCRKDFTVTGRFWYGRLWEVCTVCEKQLAEVDLTDSKARRVTDRCDFKKRTRD